MGECGVGGEGAALKFWPEKSEAAPNVATSVSEAAGGVGTRVSAVEKGVSFGTYLTTLTVS